MELYEHVFYTFAQADKNDVDLSVGRSMHVKTLKLASGPAAELLNQISDVCRARYDRLTAVWRDFKAGKIDKGQCLAQFKTITQEVH